jgi:branched-chain amino acid transport system substrate-binding protein
MISKNTRLGLAVVSLSVVGSMLLSACGGDNATATPIAQPTNTTASVAATDTTAPAVAATDTTAPTGATATTGSTTGGGGAAFTGDTIKIGIDLPLSGGDATDGLPTRNGMQLAVDQANAKGGVTIGGKKYKLETYVLDDVPPGGQAHDPAQSSKNSDSFISDPAVLGVLGPFNSANAKAMMPKLNVAGLCQISPANTNETLTKPEYGATKDLRPTGNVTYFRVVTTDDVQGPAGADFAYDKLNLRKVYILDDTEAYGKGIADNFEKEFKAKGGTVLGHDGVQKGTTDYSSIMTKIAAAGADFIYYGGTSSNNIPLARKQMKSSGLDVPLMGGDGLVDGEYIKVSGDDAIGSYGTVAAVNVQTLPEAQQFIKDYTAAGYKEGLGAYSGPGYETASILIDAMNRSTSASRDGVCQALRQTKNFKGVLGTTSFDANGDTDNKWISIYEAKAGTTGLGSDGKNSWQFVDQIKFAK